MSTSMPEQATTRLLVRPFEQGDLDAVHRILDGQFSFTGGSDQGWSREQRAAWLAWSAASHEMFGRLYQPPLGDRAIVLRRTAEVIGVCGLVAAMGPFALLPSFGGTADTRFTFELGLFYELAPEHRGQGYATEAAGALIQYAFTTLNLRRIVATTTHDNLASIGVMRRMGMTIERNPSPQPPWFQVIGVLNNSGEPPLDP